MKLHITPLLVACLSIMLCTACNDKTSSEQEVSAYDSTLPKVPDGYEVEIAAGPELVDFPMFSSLDETGRLFVFESIGNVYDKTEDALKNPRFRIKLLKDTTGDGIYDVATIFADSLSFPQGGVFYKGSLYASSAPDLLKLTDTNGDDVADKKEVILTGWTLNTNANSLVGPVMGPDGWLYMNSAIMGFDVTIKEGKCLKGETARTWRLKPDGSSLEWISAGGMNNPVELALTETGEPIGTETYFTEPLAGERDALVYWTEGGVYPKPNSNIDRDKLPRTGDLMPVITKFSRVAPSGICRYRGSTLGESFKDNFFSAQFNTHRVLRHKFSRKGASFITEEEVFFHSPNEDFHPTDVLEDADGSLLVVETGGWFIQGCPLSQVSKPELKGAIYRVRKSGAKLPEDPYGKKINWQAENVSNLVNLLEDARPFVNDQAIEKISDLGNKSLDALQTYLQKSNEQSGRVRAVFALYRIGTTESMKIVRSAINDKNADVSVAAARCAGMYKDAHSLPALLDQLKHASAAAKRQAATALGQIGKKEAIPALLDAAADETDRFVEHAIIYALISLNEPSMIKQGLTRQTVGEKKAAMIALDQIASSPLAVNDISPFLNSGNDQLQHSALWVASHHPEWTEKMIAYISDQLNDSAQDQKSTAMFANIMMAYSGETKMQQFLSDAIERSSGEKQLLLLEVMEKSPVKNFPQGWVNTLRKMLSSAAKPEIKSKTIEIIQLHQVKSLNNNLVSTADDVNNPVELRLQALAASMPQSGKLNDARFVFVFQQLSGNASAPLKQQAASILEKSALTENQLNVLANNFLPKADVYTLNRLIPVFEGAHSSQIGNTVARTLYRSPGLDGFSEENIKKLFAKYPPATKPAVDSVLMKLKQVRSQRLARLQELEKSVKQGNLDNGRVLFYGKATCGTCHTIGKQGGNMGPDLTSIQRDRSTHDLLEAIVYPSASFVREYETYVIKTNQGSHTGVIRQRSPTTIELTVSPQSSIRIPVSDIASIELSEVSMMPQGFDKILSQQEMADLVTFLLGQDQDPETDSEILR